ncbi:hypothetical protein C8E97_2881 [Saccharothrix australiensis]|uniref:Uncharacterized protein n=1 Tax=Saccharothrix australiensis TaxID=2072 RepID=A0A495W0P5_9PSEU|nr:hypothetical protein C8E97_2881 [Saccharothrix australiensis]
MVEADLGAWRTDARFDLVTTHYAHPAMPQPGFYDWVPSGASAARKSAAHGASPADRKT